MAAPEVLRDVFTRSSAARTTTLSGSGAGALVAGLALIRFQYGPPLSNGEEQGVGIGIGLCSLAFVAAFSAFRLPNLAQVAFEQDRLVWLFLRVKAGEQSAMLGTADGVLVPLRLDRPGVQFTVADEQQLFAALAAKHPGVVVGYSAEAERKFKAGSRAAPAGPVTRLKRRWLVMLAVPVVVAIAASFILHALDL